MFTGFTGKSVEAEGMCNMNMLVCTLSCGGIPMTAHNVYYVKLLVRADSGEDGVLALICRPNELQ